MGYDTIFTTVQTRTTTIQPDAKFWIARTDGEPITLLQYTNLEDKMIKHQGGPAHAIFKIQCDHWDQMEPISLIPITHAHEGDKTHCIWEKLRRCMEAAQEIGAVIFGHFQLTELIDGFWVEHLKIEYRRNDPENPQILYRQPGEWGPLDD